MICKQWLFGSLRSPNNHALIGDIGFWIDDIGDFGFWVGDIGFAFDSDDIDFVFSSDVAHLIGDIGFWVGGIGFASDVDDCDDFAFASDDGGDFVFASGFGSAIIVCLASGEKVKKSFMDKKRNEKILFRSCLRDLVQTHHPLVSHFSN